MYVPITPYDFGTNPGANPSSGCGCCGGMGSFSMNGTGLLGTGLFASSDISTWGAGEYIAIGVGVLMVYSLFSTGKRATRRVSRGIKRVRSIPRRRREAKAEKLEAQARQIREAA